MAFKLIKGRFHVKQYSPDGDSIRFQPDDAALLHSLTNFNGFRPRINARGHVQLRIEAIDTLETHYSPPSGGGVYHQPDQLAHAAMDRLLAFTGITDVQWDTAHSAVLSANDATRGYVLSRAIEKNGRPIAFVFAGEAPETDGADVFLDPARLSQSYNHAALAEGLAYPTYYKGLFNDLRDHLSAAVREARAANRGLWSIDSTSAGFDATELRVITADVAILPKLFRRLCEYMVSYGTAVGFKQKLNQSREPVLDLRAQNFTHFDTFIAQDEDGTNIRLTCNPEDLVFDEMPQRPANQFSALMGEETSAPPRFVRTLTLPPEAVFDISTY
ncbi:MAG TPA: hypothetical protein VGW40_10400 [Allosphingosinicella sp.]|nr:hypothetical protein [Allosphingosinicella sp.]